MENPAYVWHLVANYSKGSIHHIFVSEMYQKFFETAGLGERAWMKVNARIAGVSTFQTKADCPCAGYPPKKNRISMRLIRSRWCNRAWVIKFGIKVRSTTSAPKMKLCRLASLIGLVSRLPELKPRRGYWSYCLAPYGGSSLIIERSYQSPEHSQ